MPATDNKRELIRRRARLDNAISDEVIEKRQRPEVVDDAGLDPHLRPEMTVNWLAGSWLIALHVLALAAPFTFTWEALVATVILHWAAGSIGICLGFHRLLTHSGFKTYRPVKLFFAVIGAIAGEGSALDWVANHRKHHAHSDQEGDPHSPKDGTWWSHMFWLAFCPKDVEAHHKRWAPDLHKDAAIRFIDKMFLPTNIALGFALLGIGYWLGGWPVAWSMVIWGMFLRLVLVLHTTWLVNSMSHIWGYRNYETTDTSKNNWFVALIAYGEGWHNNHHAYPRMAIHGHKWWEIDMTYAVIRMMRVCGLAWDVVDYKKRSAATD